MHWNGYGDVEMEGTPGVRRRSRESFREEMGLELSLMTQEFSSGPGVER